MNLFCLSAVPRAPDVQSKFRADVQGSPHPACFKVEGSSKSAPTLVHQTEVNSCVETMQPCFSLKPETTRISSRGFRICPPIYEKLAVHAGICLLWGCVVFFFSCLRYSMKPSGFTSCISKVGLLGKLLLQSQQLCKSPSLRQVCSGR